MSQRDLILAETTISNLEITVPSEWCHDDAEKSSINFNIRLLIFKKSLLIKTLF